MKISYTWLKDYVNTELGVEEISNLLTSTGLEVEGVEIVENIKGGLENFVIGYVNHCEAHSNSDHLHITKVDIGDGKSLDIVCGAPNITKGQKVVVAKNGAKIYTSDNEYFTIKKTKLRGVESNGMICSEAELQFSDNHDGILVLEEDAEVGMPAREYFGIEEDYVFEIGLTPNRSDATSHIGVARDLIAAIKQSQKASIELITPKVNHFEADNNNNPIELLVDRNLSPRYSGLTITNLKVDESPDWLKDRLKLIGLNPINNIVDITNYVLFETGQPLHAFDLDKIEGGRIEVKTLAPGEKFITLDNEEKKLNGDEIMICDSKKPLCMGGIYGGANSGVDENTKAIFLESAYFDPVRIRKASKHHNLHTDASFRFERGSDPNNTIFALKRAALLIKEICQGEISSEIIDIYPNPILPKEIEINFERLNRLAGQEIESNVVVDILESLGIEIIGSNNEGLVVSVPTYKTDVEREIDVFEEVLRIYGYDNIEVSDNVKASLSYRKKPDIEKVQNIVSDMLVANGFYEIMNNSLTKSSYYKDNQDFPIELSPEILNPLSQDLSLLRQSLVYGGLETLEYNINRRMNNLSVFEFGNTYIIDKDNADNEEVSKRYIEENHLSLILTGNRFEETWIEEEKKVDFFYTKNIAMNILRRLGIDVSRFLVEETKMDLLSTGLEYIHRDNKKTILYIGQIDKKTLKRFDIKQDVFIANFNWSLVLRAISNRDVKYKEVPKFPEVRRDLALVVDKETSFDELIRIARQTEKKILKDISLFDVFEGDKLPKGKKQYALSFILQDENKTLTDKIIDSTMNRLIKAFESKAGGKLR